MQQLTQQEAIAIHHSKVWERWTAHEIVKIQLFQNHLLVPFSKFHEAIEKVLDRPVFTHEFAFPDHLRKEFLGELSPPTFEDIIKLIPDNKLGADSTLKS